MDDSSLPKAFIGVFVGIAFLVLFFNFYQALIFPIVSWDSLTTFAYLGRLFFQASGIPTVTGACLSANFPPLVPLLYSWFYMIYGSVEELFSKAVSPLYAAITALVTYAFSKLVYGSKTKAWGAVFFLVTIPIFMYTSEDCLSDIPLMFYSVSSMYFLYLSIKDEKKRDRAVIASGLMCGLAAWTKYNALFLVFVVLAIFVLKRFVFAKEKNSFTVR
jgi:4-amino-4-deoxy-L-arabinose transferase-like glycosyltransferase